MKYRYDLHIHSALSPCSDDNMTPVNIVGSAKLKGLDFVAISDHNAIANVEVGLKAGKSFGIKVVPAFELQTNEEIHLLCLFESFKDLKGFYDSIKFADIKNRKEIFGNQLIIDEDDNIIGEEETMLLASSEISSNDVPKLIENFNGIAIPAHIDREMNGMLNILGTITDGFDTVELSAKADSGDIQIWSKSHNVIVDSDAHALSEISGKGIIELNEYSIRALIEKLKQKVGAK